MRQGMPTLSFDFLLITIGRSLLALLLGSYSIFYWTLHYNPHVF